MMVAGRTTIAVILCLGLGGCGAGSPVVITGSETTVSIEAGKWSNPMPLAVSFCAQYERDAVEVGHGSFNYNENIYLYVYDCVER